MRDLIEISYTGDLLAHRRCARAWVYEKKAGFLPYEAVQAMEGRLVHHAMEWLARQYHEEPKRGVHADVATLRAQLEKHFSVLWARGIRTTFASKRETLDRVMHNLYPQSVMDPIVKAVIEGALHTEYELRAVKKVLPVEFAGKSRVLLTGVLDVVVQQQQPLRYERSWEWDDLPALRGHPVATALQASTGEIEVWDYKATRSATIYANDYVRQVLTYAALYRERTGLLPRRCVLFFINEPNPGERLLAIDVSEAIILAALAWTEQQAKALHGTFVDFQKDPSTVIAGELDLRSNPTGKRLGRESVQQCTACSFRFDCAEYKGYLKGGPLHPDVDIKNVLKN